MNGSTLRINLKGWQETWVMKSFADIARPISVQKFMFMFDQDASLVAPWHMVPTELGRSHEAIMEASSAGEHHANGVVECAVQMVGGVQRTHKLASEQTYGREIQADHAVSLRLIMYAAAKVSLLDVGSKGRIAYERFCDKQHVEELLKGAHSDLRFECTRCTSARV